MASERTGLTGHRFVARAKSYMAQNGLANLNLPPEYQEVSMWGRGGTKLEDYTRSSSIEGLSI